MQNYVEFDGGGRGTKIQGDSMAWDASAKKSAALQKNQHFSLGLSQIHTYGYQNTTSLPFGNKAATAEQRTWCWLLQEKHLALPRELELRGCINASREGLM